MKVIEDMAIPSVDQIISDTGENLDSIMMNIARNSNVYPSHLDEQESNTNMLLMFKRYVNGLNESRLIFQPGVLDQVHKLICISDNITNATFLRITDLLEVDWCVVMVNPNHRMKLIGDGSRILDVERNESIKCTLGDMLLSMMTHTVNQYGEVDLKKNTSYIPSYSVTNIMTAIRHKKRMSSYVFEKFCKIWNISYSYRITSRKNPKYLQEIIMDPSGWM